QCGAADAQPAQPGLRAWQRVPAVDPDEVALHVDRDGAARGQVGGGAGQQILDRREAAGEQAVQVRVMRDAPAAGGRGRQRVAVDERDRREVFVECPGGQQAADARAEHDRVPGPVCGWHVVPSWLWSPWEQATPKGTKSRSAVAKPTTAGTPRLDQLDEPGSCDIEANGDLRSPAGNLAARTPPH